MSDRQQRQEDTLFSSYGSPPALANANADANNDDSDIRNMRLFTVEDLRADLAAMSIDELALVQSDLSGLSSHLVNVDGVSPLCPGASSIPQLISKLNSAMSKLPADRTSVYYKAVEKCPNLVGSDCKLAFLEHDNGDAVAAAERLAAHWEIRLKMFGEDRCFLPTTLKGALKDEVQNMLTRPLVELSPSPDAAGRAVIVFRSGLRNLQEYSFEQEMMSLWYVLQNVTEKSADLRKKGFVVLVDTRNVNTKCVTKKDKLTFHILQSAFPIAFRGMHIISSGILVQHLLYPIAQGLAPMRVRIRMRIHCGTAEQVKLQLQSYSLPPQFVPADFGGSVVLNKREWLVERQIMEQIRESLGNDQICCMEMERLEAGIRQQAATNAAATASVEEFAALTSSAAASRTTANALKRTRSLQESSNIFASKCSAGGMEMNETSRNRSDAALYQLHLEENQRRPNRKKADTRMDRAVIERLRNPALKRLDALMIGGFVFMDGASKNQINEMKQTEVFDSENISLAQRKNQLNRRLRSAEQWLRNARANGVTMDLSSGQDAGDSATQQQPAVGNTATSTSTTGGDATQSSATKGSDAANALLSMMQPPKKE